MPLSAHNEVVPRNLRVRTPPARNARVPPPSRFGFHVPLPPLPATSARASEPGAAGGSLAAAGCGAGAATGDLPTTSTSAPAPAPSAARSGARSGPAEWATAGAAALEQGQEGAGGDDDGAASTPQAPRPGAEGSTGGGRAAPGAEVNGRPRAQQPTTTLQDAGMGAPWHVTGRKPAAEHEPGAGPHPGLAAARGMQPLASESQPTAPPAAAAAVAAAAASSTPPAQRHYAGSAPASRAAGNAVLSPSGSSHYPQHGGGGQQPGAMAAGLSAGQPHAQWQQPRQYAGPDLNASNGVDADMTPPRRSGAALAAATPAAQSAWVGAAPAAAEPSFPHTAIRSMPANAATPAGFMPHYAAHQHGSGLPQHPHQQRVTPSLVVTRPLVLSSSPTGLLRARPALCQALLMLEQSPLSLVTPAAPAPSGPAAGNPSAGPARMPPSSIAAAAASPGAVGGSTSAPAAGVVDARVEVVVVERAMEAPDVVLSPSSCLCVWPVSVPDDRVSAF